MSIKKSFSVGNKGEGFVQQLFQLNGYECEKNTDMANKYHYDLLCKSVLGVNFSIECKYDVMACRTSNLAIEFWNSKKNEPSGITATKSDIWAHIILDGDNMVCWLAKTKNLQAFVKDNKPWKTIIGGGDNNANLYLFELDRILGAVFSRACLLNKSEFEKLVSKLLK